MLIFYSDKNFFYTWKQKLIKLFFVYKSKNPH